ncbi:MAG: putative metalloprotease with PDZ domain, partial [Colwellia sp.]
KLSVTFFRRDELFTRLVTLGTTPKAKLKIVPVEQVSEAQKAFFKQWTGIDFPSI